MEKLDDENLLNSKDTNYDAGIKKIKQLTITETRGAKCKKCLHEKKFIIVTTLFSLATLMSIYLKDRFFTKVALDSIKKNCLPDSENITSCINQFNGSTTNAAIAVDIIFLFTFAFMFACYINLNREKFFNKDDLKNKANACNNEIKKQIPNQQINEQVLIS